MVRRSKYGDVKLFALKLTLMVIIMVLVVTMRSWGVVFGGVMLIFLSFVLQYEIQFIEIKQASRLLFGVTIVFGVSTVLIWLSGNQHLLHMFLRFLNGFLIAPSGTDAAFSSLDFSFRDVPPTFNDGVGLTQSKDKNLLDLRVETIQKRYPNTVTLFASMSLAFIVTSITAFALICLSIQKSDSDSIYAQVNYGVILIFTAAATFLLWFAGDVGTFESTALHHLYSTDFPLSQNAYMDISRFLILVCMIQFMNSYHSKEKYT